jgi:hypothetical protein
MHVCVSSLPRGPGVPDPAGSTGPTDGWGRGPQWYPLDPRAGFFYFFCLGSATLRRATPCSVAPFSKELPHVCIDNRDPDTLLPPRLTP